MNVASGTYSRVYHQLADEFPAIWDDDACLSLWLRLLVMADKAWPQAAPIPRSAKARPWKLLTGSHLVEQCAGQKFRIKGMDAERSARSTAASNAARIRHGTALSMPNRVEQRRVEQNINGSLRSPSRAGEIMKGWEPK